MAKSSDHYVDRDCPMPSSWAQAFDELVYDGLLVLAEQDSWGLRQVSLTNTGAARYVQLSIPPHRTDLRIPDPQFPAVSHCGVACLVEHTGLPVRSPGAHLHPQLRRPLVAGRCGVGGSSN